MRCRSSTSMKLSDDDIRCSRCKRGCSDDSHREGRGLQRVHQAHRYGGLRYYGKKIYGHHAHRGWRREFHAAHCRGSAPGPSHGRRRRHGPRVPRNSNGHVHHWRRVGNALCSFIDEKGNIGVLWRPSTNKWVENICPCRLHHDHAAAALVVDASTVMDGLDRCKRVRRARHRHAQPRNWAARFARRWTRRLPPRI